MKVISKVTPENFCLNCLKIWVPLNQRLKEYLKHFRILSIMNSPSMQLVCASVNKKSTIVVSGSWVEAGQAKGSPSRRAQQREQPQTTGGEDRAEDLCNARCHSQVAEVVIGMRADCVVKSNNEDPSRSVSSKCMEGSFSLAFTSGVSRSRCRTPSRDAEVLDDGMSSQAGRRSRRRVQIGNMTIPKNSHSALPSDGHFFQALEGRDPGGATTSFGIHPGVLGMAEIAGAEAGSIVVYFHRVVGRIRRGVINHAEMPAETSAGVDVRQYLSQV